jgi:hypothetical protein
VVQPLKFLSRTRLTPYTVIIFTSYPRSISFLSFPFHFFTSRFRLLFKNCSKRWMSCRRAVITLIAALWRELQSSMFVSSLIVEYFRLNDKLNFCFTKTVGIAWWSSIMSAKSKTVGSSLSRFRNDEEINAYTKRLEIRTYLN